MLFGNGSGDIQISSIVKMGLEFVPGETLEMKHWVLTAVTESGTAKHEFRSAGLLFIFLGFVFWMSGSLFFLSLFIHLCQQAIHVISFCSCRLIQGVRHLHQFSYLRGFRAASAKVAFVFFNHPLQSIGTHFDDVRAFDECSKYA